jgi:peptide/nickel transport system substrate-binding protein
MTSRWPRNSRGPQEPGEAGIVVSARHAAVRLLATSLVLLGLACSDRSECTRCDTLVIAATGEPGALLPPLVGGTVERDISDLIYERLADLGAGGSPLDSSAMAPRLAVRWERVDPVTLRFHLRQGARWHDSVPVTAADVVFSFEAYADSALDAQARATLAGRVTASATDDSTVLIRFSAPDPEQWYDATSAVRVLPRHLWDSIPRGRWADTPAESRVVGSGPYRLGGWVKGQSISLERVGAEPSAPEIRRIVWRFTEDQDAALNLLLSHEADLLESIGDSARVARVAADPTISTMAYPSAVYGFLGFNLDAPNAAAVKTPAVRRALAMATDRATAARAALGPGAVAPPGPMSRSLWIYDETIPVPPFDIEAAAALLDSAGWRPGSDGVRARAGRSLAVDILVPATSVARRNLAQIVQEMWRKIGVAATITSVDFPVFQERLRTGKFESFIGAWLDEPSPRGLAEQWTTAGVGVLNYGRYRSRVFDSLFRIASSSTRSVGETRYAWHQAMTQLNREVPAIWLYTSTNVAGVAKRVQGVRINPYSWLAGVRLWKVVDPS